MNKFSLLFLVFCYGLSHGQVESLSNNNVAVKFSSEYSTPQKKALDLGPANNLYMKKEIVYAETGSNFYVVTFHQHVDNNLTTIEGFNEALASSFHAKYTPAVKNRKANTIGAFNFNNKPHLLLLQASQDNKSFSVYSVPISDNGEIKEEPALIEAFPSSEGSSGFALKALSMKNWMNVDKQKYNSVRSANGQYYGLFYREGGMASKGTKIDLLLLDNKMNKWSKSFDIDINNIDFLNEGFYISNDGLLIFNCSEKKQKNNMGYATARYQYGVILSKTYSKHFGYDEFFKKNFITEIKVDFDKENNPSYFYTYRKGHNDDELEGAAIAKINPTEFRISKTDHILLNKKTLSSYKMKEFERIYVSKNYHIASDESKYIVFEKLKSKGIFASAYKVASSFFNEEDLGKILVMSLNSQNRLSDIKEITKEPFDENFIDYRGVSSILINDSLNLFYNTVNDNTKSKNVGESSISAIRAIFNTPYSEPLYSKDMAETILNPNSLTRVDHGRYLGVTSSETDHKGKYIYISFAPGPRPSMSSNNTTIETPASPKVEAAPTQITSETNAAIAPVAAPAADVKKEVAPPDVVPGNKELSKESIAKTPAKKLDEKVIQDTLSKTNKNRKDKIPASAAEKNKSKKADKPSEVKEAKKEETAPIKEETKKEIAAPVVEKDTTTKVIPNPEYRDVNATYKSELAAKNAAIDAGSAKVRAMEAKLNYYKELRLKFEQEAKEKRIKDSVAAIEKSKRDAQAYDNRHLKPQDAPQFEKLRSGAKPADVKKKTAEEEYEELFIK